MVTRNTIEEKQKRRQKISAILAVLLMVLLGVILLKSRPDKRETAVPLSDAIQRTEVPASATKASVSKTALTAPLADAKSLRLNWETPGPIAAVNRDPQKYVPPVESLPEIETDEQEEIEPEEPDWMATLRRYTLRGIVYSDRSTAIIGQQLLHAGDQIEGVEVVEIGTDSVTFKEGNRTWTRRIGQTVVDKE